MVAITAHSARPDPSYRAVQGRDRPCASQLLSMYIYLKASAKVSPSSYTYTDPPTDSLCRPPCPTLVIRSALEYEPMSPSCHLPVKTAWTSGRQGLTTPSLYSHSGISMISPVRYRGAWPPWSRSLTAWPPSYRSWTCSRVFGTAYREGLEDKSKFGCPSATPQ